VEKAGAVTGDVVLAADTIVDIDGDVLGKPVDEDEARAMLTRLSGRSHWVHTGVAVRQRRGVEVEVVATEVVFAPLTPGTIERYVATGEPLDKAGAYAIQGAGGAFVAAIAGSPSNVVGLPLATVAPMLARAGLAVVGAGRP
jgi:septum formation protein